MKEELQKEIVEKVSGALEAIADQVGVGVEHFWPLFIKEQTIQGYLGIFTFGFIIFIGLVLYKIYPKIREIAVKDHRENYPTLADEWDPAYVVLAGLVAVMYSFILILSTIGFINSVGILFNPEFHALKAVMDMVK